ncbi:MAG: hypothetical protein WBH50_01565, partial [Fuerstiella sp.]
ADSPAQRLSSDALRIVGSLEVMICKRFVMETHVLIEKQTPERTGDAVSVNRCVSGDICE